MSGKFDPKNIPSLEGKVIMVTGGNAGLGKETIIQLAKHNPKEIFLAARSQAKAEAALEEIKKEAPDSNVSFVQMDLSSLKSIQKAAEEVKTRSNNHLDILINNAGVMCLPYSLTEDGYEIQFGTNHVGHALLTRLLLPTLLKTAEEPNSDVRVINITSSGHQMAPVREGIIYDQNELKNWGPWRRYGQSKLANLLHARELGKRYPSITATSVHPGVVMTDLFNTANSGGTFLRVTSAALGTLSTDVNDGAHNQLWAATAPKDKVRTSYYWTPVGKKNNGSFWNASKPKLAEDLWEWTEKELEKKGY